MWSRKGPATGRSQQRPGGSFQVEICTHRDGCEGVCDGDAALVSEGRSTPHWRGQVTAGRAWLQSDICAIGGHRTPVSPTDLGLRHHCEKKQHTVSGGAVSYSGLKEVRLITKPSRKVLIISVYVQERASQFSWSIRHTPVQTHSTRHLTSNSSKVSSSWKTREGIKNSHSSEETGEAWWTISAAFWPGYCGRRGTLALKLVRSQPLFLSFDKCTVVM